MHTVNWRQGFRRLSNAFLAIVWVGTLFLQGVDAYHGRFSAASFGEAVAGLFFFTVVWMLLAAGVAWIARGFTQPGG